MGKATKKMVTGNHRITYLTASGLGETTAGELTCLRAIRLKCLDCSGGSHSEVRQCAVEACPLYPFRAEPNDTN